MYIGEFSPVYGAVAALSVLLFVGTLLWDKQKERFFLALFGCVAAANCGYFLLSVCKTLPLARFANGLSYFGGAYSMLVMLRIILDVCQMRRRAWLNGLLLGISTAAFLLAASGDLLGLYYAALSLEQAEGMVLLVKTYGPLHRLYTVYLVCYVLVMVAIIVYATAKKRLAAPKYAMLLIAAVLLNIGVWAVEQGFQEQFEFLSVSYIVTEVMMLLVYGMLRDYGIVQPGGSLVTVQMLTKLHSNGTAPGQLPPGMQDLFDSFVQKAKTLSAAENRILRYYIDGYEISEIPELAFISIHTVKKHNRSIYQKLEITSRDELMLYIELFRCCGRLEELTGAGAEE